MGVSDLGGVCMPPYVWMNPKCPTSPTHLYRSQYSTVKHTSLWSFCLATLLTRQNTFQMFLSTLVVKNSCYNVISMGLPHVLYRSDDAYCNVFLCLIWWQTPHVLVYLSLFLVLAIMCVSNKCMQLYTYASTIWHYMAIGQLQGMC